jgi:hypothetical protein
LSLETISDIWRADTTQHFASQCHAHHSSTRRCIFAWISGLSQQQQDSKWIETLFKANTIENNGWNLVNENGKMGYMPNKVGNKMTLLFSNLTQPIRSVTFFILKSYGSKWEGSRVRAQVSKQQKDTSEWELLSSLEMQGTHAKNTSEMYPETMEFPIEIPQSSSLQVSYELTGGSTFKIMGLTICS